jgi:restriction system protein
MKQLEKQAREAHVAAKEAEVEERNLRLEEIYSEIDALLLSTLGIDDHVDLEAFRKK